MLKRVWIPSPNYSSRGGTDVRLIVLHTAEGAMTIESLGNFFASSSSGVSSHAGADDKPNTVGEYVRRENKAWTAASFNPCAVQIELCAFASWTPQQWYGHPTLLENCAKWIAEEAAEFGIPLVKLSPAQAQGPGRGVCQHADLGAGGGGHWDCGPGFPIDHVLAMASGSLAEEEEEMDALIIRNPRNGGMCLLQVSTGEWRGFSSPDLVNWYKAQGVKEGTGLTTSQFDDLKQVGTLD